jgi:hypothetical protein
MWLLRWSRLACVFSRIFSPFSALSARFQRFQRVFSAFSAFSAPFQVLTMAVVRADGGARRRGEYSVKEERAER